MNKKIVQFKQLQTGAEFMSCYNFKSPPMLPLRFTKRDAGSALLIKPTVFEGRPIYFRGQQPVLELGKKKLPRPKLAKLAKLAKPKRRNLK